MHLAKDDLQAIEQIVDKKLDPIKSDIKQIKSDLDPMKADIKQIKSDLAPMKTDLKQIKADVKLLAALNQLEEIRKTPV